MTIEELETLEKLLHKAVDSEEIRGDQYGRELLYDAKHLVNYYILKETNRAEMHEDPSPEC